MTRRALMAMGTAAMKTTDIQHCELARMYSAHCLAFIDGRM